MRLDHSNSSPLGISISQKSGKLHKQQRVMCGFESPNNDEDCNLFTFCLSICVYLSVSVSTSPFSFRLCCCKVSDFLLSFGYLTSDFSESLESSIGCSYFRLTVAGTLLVHGAASREWSICTLIVVTSSTRLSLTHSSVV